MTLHVKNVVEDKFWIVQDVGGEKIGTIQSVHDGVVFVKKDMSREKFNSINILSDKYNLVFDEDDNDVVSDEAFNVHGFPCETSPHNAVYDLSKKLPIFTKREKSTSFYSAGYFIIKFAHGWVRSYCPKLITLQRYEFRGPFKNKLEMSEALRRANNE